MRVPALQESGDYSEAEGHCLRLMDVGGLNKEKAKALLRDIRALQSQRQHTPLNQPNLAQRHV